MSREEARIELNRHAQNLDYLKAKLRTVKVIAARDGYTTEELADTIRKIRIEMRSVGRQVAKIIAEQQMVANNN